MISAIAIVVFAIVVVALIAVALGGGSKHTRSVGNGSPMYVNGRPQDRF